MDNLLEFLQMGGHASYIWPAYGLVTVVLLALFFSSLRFANRSESQFKALTAKTTNPENSESK